MMRIVSVLFRVPAAVLIQLWRQSPRRTSFSIILYALLSLQNISLVYMTREIVVKLNMGDVTLAASYVGAAFILQVVFMWLDVSNHRNEFRLQEEYNLSMQSMLVDSLTKKELNVIEHPGFRGKWGTLSFSVSKYYESYLTCIQMVQSAISLSLHLAFLLQLHFSAALIVILFLTLKIFVQRKYFNERVRLNNAQNRNQRVHEYFFYLLTLPEYQKELRVSRIEGFLKQKWIDYKRNNSDTQYRINLLQTKGRAFLGLLNTASTSVISLVILLLIARDQAGVAEYIAATMAVLNIETGISNLVLNVTSQLEYRKYIREFEEWKMMDNMEEEEKQPLVFEQDIVVKGLNFHYPNTDMYALQDVNMHVQKGEKVVILGDNGAGKSTLIRLLLGLYQAEPHTIFYDGVCQTRINRKSIWDRSSVIFQDFIKYMLTIRENLSLGQHMAAAKEDVDAVLDEFNLSQLRQAKNGYDTPLGSLSDDAINLSGGQWQRLALARMFLIDKDLLIFDEPTSALDPLSELQVFEKIMSRLQHQTVVVITHRVGLAKKADKVVLMKAGRIIEQGRHADLLNRSDYYREIWEKQSEWYA